MKLLTLLTCRSNMLLTCVLPCLPPWPQLLADLAVQPDSAEVWAYLARLYLDVLRVSDWKNWRHFMVIQRLWLLNWPFMYGTCMCVVHAIDCYGCYVVCIRAWLGHQPR